MAKGEKRFSVGNRKTKRFDNDPVPAGEHTLVVGKGWEVRAAGKESKSGLRYVNGYFVVPEVAEGKRQYHMFFIDMSEGSDGTAMVDRQGGVTEFIKALGLTDIPVSVIQMKKKDGTTVDVLNPKQLCDWLNSLDGTELRGKTKLEKRNDDPDTKQSRIDFFIEADESAEDDDGGGLEDEDETDLDADEEESDEEESDDEDADEESDDIDEDESEDDEEESDDEETDEDEDEEEPEEKPAPKKGKGKPAPKPEPKKAPASKKKGKK